MQIISQYLDQWVGSLWNLEQKLVNITNGAEASKKLLENIKNTKKCERNAMKVFIGRFK